jgi:hypothetical protein
MGFRFNPFTGNFDNIGTSGPSSGSGIGSGGISYPLGSAYPLTLSSSDSGKIVLVDTSQARSITLPQPSLGLSLVFKDAKGLTEINPITLVRYTTEKIEGEASDYNLESNWGSWTLVSDGTDWFIL